MLDAFAFNNDGLHQEDHMLVVNLLFVASILCFEGERIEHVVGVHFDLHAVVAMELLDRFV